MKKVYLDPGHGGIDSGAKGSGLEEKAINLSVTLKVGKILDKNKIEVVYTRSKDVRLELKERTNRANTSKADIFVSIHCNSSVNSSAKGVETFYYPGKSKSLSLANDIQDELSKTKLLVNRGVKTADFHVIRESNMPSSLVELGFITNKEDSNTLKNKQDILALAIANGIMKYLGVSYIGEEEYAVQKVKININGKIKEVDAINKEGNNYVKLQDLRDEKISIDYDKDKKLPILKVR